MLTNATIAETTNYNGATCSAGSFTISKANVSCSTSKGNYTFAGTRGNPSVSSNPGSGTVTYYYRTTTGTSGGTNYSSITSSSLNVGTYYMYATIAANNGYDAYTTQAEIVKSGLVTDKWIELEFDFSAWADRQDFDKVVIQFGGEGHDAPGTFFLDDFYFGE